MSFIIKGLDIPEYESEEVIIIIKPNGEVRDHHGILLTDAKAIQIPTPHGRIIDEKEVSKIVNERTLGWGWEYASGYTVLKAIDDAPTILEAEE